VGALAAGLFAVTYTVHRNTADCRMESLVTLGLLVALLGFTSWLESDRVRGLLLWGAASGLAVLAKGPLGLAAIAAGVLYLLLFERSRFRGKGLPSLGLGLVVCVAVGGWWWAWMLTHTDAAHVFVRGQVFDRVVAGVLGPLGLADRFAPAVRYPSDPPWSYAVWLVTQHAYLLPFLVIGAIALARERRRDAGLRLHVVFAGLVVVGAHAMATKHTRYLYPALPLASLVSAYGLARLWRTGGERFVAYAAVAVATFFLLYPGPLYRDDFRALREVREAAALTGWPLVLDERFLAAGRGRAAAIVHLDEWQGAPPADGAWWRVSDEKTPSEDAPVFASRRVRVHLVLPPRPATP
jgi:4-amino-4-deoxy-L-arabinose transferase-like glycosyltransferase